MKAAACVWDGWVMNRIVQLSRVQSSSVQFSPLSMSPSPSTSFIYPTCDVTIHPAPIDLSRTFSARFDADLKPGTTPSRPSIHECIPSPYKSKIKRTHSQPYQSRESQAGSKQKHKDSAVDGATCSCAVGDGGRHARGVGGKGTGREGKTADGWAGRAAASLHTSKEETRRVHRVA